MYPLASDSSKLEKAELTNRNWILRNFRSGLQSTDSPQVFAKNHEYETAQSLLSQEYKASKRYQTLDTYVDETSSPTGRTEQDFDEQANQTHHYVYNVTRMPFRDYYLVLLTEIVETIKKYQKIPKTVDSVQLAYGELLSSLLNYAQKVADQYQDFRNVKSQDMKTTLSQFLFDITNTSKDYTEDPSVKPICSKYWEMIYALTQPTTYEEIMKFVLTKSLGSSGIAYIEDLSFPFAVTILPDIMSPQSVMNIWKHRFQKEKDYKAATAQAKKIDDTELQKLEGMLTDKLKYGIYDTLRNALINYAFPPSVVDDDGKPIHSPADQNPPTPSQTKKTKKPKMDEEFPDPNEEGSTSKDKKPKKDKKQKGKDTGKGKGPDNDEEPDDDDYEPDALLASLASAKTAAVQANPDDYEALDHMTRFKSKDENPRSVSKSKVTNSDYFITSRTRYGTQRYMVTYTRKSHKPVFNLII